MDGIQKYGTNKAAQMKKWVQEFSKQFLRFKHKGKRVLRKQATEDSVMLVSEQFHRT